MTTNTLPDVDKYAKMRSKAVDYFMRGLTKKAALLRAGYSESVASTDAKSVFDRDDVQEEIARRQVNLAKKANVDANWIVERLMSIADANLGDLIVIDDEGRASVDMALLTPDMRRALGEFTVDEYTKGRGPNAVPVTKMKIKTVDKLRALEMLGKHLNLFTDTIKIEGDADLINRLYAGRERVGAEEDGE